MIDKLLGPCISMKDVEQINGLNIQCVRPCKQVKVDVNNLHLQMTSRRSKSESLGELM